MGRGQITAPGRRGSPRFELLNALFDSITNDNCRKGNSKENPRPGPLWLEVPPAHQSLGGAAEKVERRGEGKEEAPGTISELTVTPPATALAPGGRAGARGRPPRVPVPGPAEHGVETDAGREPPVSPRPLQIGLCSREDSSFLSRTLPATLRPSSSPHFFPGGRVPTHWRPLGWPPGTREARGPRRAGCVGDAESRWAAAGLVRGAPVPGGRHSAQSPVATSAPAHSPMYLWPVRWGRVAAAAAEPGTGPGSQLPALGPRRASGYPGAGVSRPIGARGDSALTAVPGDRSSDIIDNTFLSSCFIPALCTCGGQSDNLKKNLSCASRPTCPSTGQLLFICPLKAVTAK